MRLNHSERARTSAAALAQASLALAHLFVALEVVVLAIAFIDATDERENLLFDGYRLLLVIRQIEVVETSLHRRHPGL
jgi:hypothetical protein